MTRAARATPVRPRLTRLAAVAGAAGPPLFLAVVTLTGWLTPGYDARTQTVSELALGPLGWLLNAALYGIGAALVAAGAALLLGLRRAALPAGGPAALALAVAGAGCVVAAVYPTDVPGTPATPAGEVHNLAFLAIFAALAAAPAGAAVALRRAPDWGGLALGAALTPAAVLALLAVFVLFAGDPGDPLHGGAGLLERALIAVALGWVVATNRRLLTAGAVPRPAAPGDSTAS
jgi:hypothetical protein